MSDREKARSRLSKRPLEGVNIGTSSKPIKLKVPTPPVRFDFKKEYPSYKETKESK